MKYDALTDPVTFAALGGVFLRAYQQEAIRAIARAVQKGEGASFAVMFPRQSGKNELQAQLEAYLLAALAETGGEMIKISPTYQPQSLNAMRRLERVLREHRLTRGRWRRERGFRLRLERAAITFLSGAPESNIVGATASSLLEVDEAQDVLIPKFDREVAPMAASTDAVRVFWGTAWTSATLLARELRAARQVGNAFVCAADVVGAEAPQYARFVAEQVARLGRQHPVIRSQYFCEEIDGEGGMFPPERIARMGPEPLPERSGLPYAVLIDVGGEEALESGEAGAAQASASRDATAATVVLVDLAGLADPALRAPVYRPIERRLWVGMPHADLLGELLALARRWSARQVVVDATGVGAGLASFLKRALPGRVTPFVFSQSSKSKLGWDFSALVDGGRWKEPPQDSGDAELQSLFYRQMRFARYTLLPGPGKLMRWGVPDGTRDPTTGEQVHDDLLTSAALAAVLDGLEWGASGPALVVRARDPLEEMKGF